MRTFILWIEDRMAALLITISLIGFALLFSGCYTVRVLTLEARCGIGRDYVYTPRWVVNQDTGELEMHMIGRCMNKSDLKGT